ncbi:MAG: type I-A CRISPR-associated protein Cas5a [Candidatus Methanodesulfokora washburnensis]|jgi:CRISPR-associated protein Cas5a/b/c
MIGFTVDIEFVWGFQARIVGLSKTSPSFYYPPPTTFLGALAEVIAKKNNIGEDVGKFIINELSGNLLAIGFRPINCIPVKYEDLGRIIMIRVSGDKIKSPLPAEPQRSFDSPAKGKTVLSSLDENPPRIRFFIILKDKEIEVENNTLKSKISKITLEEDHFWRIHRLGSKEGTVSVVDVRELQDTDIQCSEGRYVATNYSFPVDSLADGEEIMRKWENEVYANPFDKNIYITSSGRECGIFDKYYQDGLSSLKIFRVPIIISSLNPPNYSILPANGWKAYSIRHENKREVVIGK